jgi:pyridoxal/pyridoxine/pyridoxamine kinase
MLNCYDVGCIVQGTVLSGTELSALCTGLVDNSLLRYDYLLTGYIGTVTAYRKMCLHR